MRVLILGGTAEARTLARALVAGGKDVVSSLAGRVSQPRLPVGEVRIGGFGGTSGLAEYLRTERITHVADATHPFAITMTQHGAEAAHLAEVPFLRLARPGWGDHPDSGKWHWVTSYADAREEAERLGDRPFVTTGRQTLDHFTDHWADRDVLVRVVEPLGADAPQRWTVLQDRGPYSFDGEHALMQEHGVDVLVTKDSGGSYTAAKLAVASELKVPVVVVARPEVPHAVREVASVDEAVALLHA